MKLSTNTTTVVLSITLVIALSIYILSFSSSISITIPMLKISVSPLDIDQNHPDHQHRPHNSKVDPYSFGVSINDKFLSYFADSEASNINHLRMLNCAMQISKITGRKILVYPTSNQAGDRQFSLSWLQIFNINWINSQLHPSHSPCLIRGLNYGEPDAHILAYVYNGTFLNHRNECDENVQDAPWQLRDPSSWSSDCYLLPWSVTPHVLRHMKKPIPLISSKPDLHPRFPGNGLCGKTLVEHEYHVIGSGSNSVIASLDQKLILFSGEAMLNCNSKPSLDIILPLNLHIESTIRSSLSSISRPLLCVHAQHANLSLLIQATNNIIRSNSVRHTFIVTDLLDFDVKTLQSEVIGSSQFGCDRNKFPICRNNDDMRTAIEEQICSNAEFFVASRESSLSKRIVYLRDQQASIENKSFFLS